MRVLIAAGGTAGHINPALAIAGALKKADPTAEIHFAGRKEGMEYRLVTQAGYVAPAAAVKVASPTFSDVLPLESAEVWSSTASVFPSPKLPVAIKKLTSSNPAISTN